MDLTDDFRDDSEPRVPDGGPGANKVYQETKRSKAQRERREREKQKLDDEELIRLAVKRFNRAAEAESENRTAALEDLKFKAGDQWPADIRAQRLQDKRPCLTINGIPTFTHQVENDIRQNRPGINISPVGLKANKEAAEIYAGMIRAIERASAAEVAYDTAVISAVDIGFGYFRILTEYENEGSFNQKLVIKRIRNPFTVLLDPERQEPDGSDAKWGFISELIDRSEFKEKFPKAQEVQWNERALGDAEKHWVNRDQIRVAEYLVVEHEMRRLVQLSNGHTGYYDELADSVKAQLEAELITIVNDRDVECQKVMWYRITSAEVIERQEWVGKYIPIIEVVGDEIDIEGKVIRHGVIRNAKDPARAKNYWNTAKAEFVALQPKPPFIGPEGSFDGHENEWKVANIKSFPYLEYQPVRLEDGTLAPPPTRQPPPQVPQGYVEAEQAAEQDLMRTTGIRFDATINERTYDESGKALHELRRTSDIGSFHYFDNFARSLRFCGRQLIDLIPKIYSEDRILAIVNEDGTDSMVKVSPGASMSLGTVQTDQNTAPMRVFNPKIGEYEVTVTVGPTYATRRIEAQEQLTQFINKVPETMRGVIAAVMAKYSDWPGSNELYKELVKMLPPGTLSPDPKDIPPAVAAQLGALGNQVQQLMTERMQLLRDLTDRRTDQALVKEKIDKDFDAKMTKIAADIQTELLKLYQGLEGQVQEVIQSVEQMSQSFQRQSTVPEIAARMANQILAQ